jgi:hypothetical protein
MINLIISFFVVLAVVIPDVIADLIDALTPLIVLGATAVVTWARKKIPDIVIITLIVPIISLGYALLTEFIDGGILVWWQQAIYGLIAVFIHQVYRKFQNPGELKE